MQKLSERFLQDEVLVAVHPKLLNTRLKQLLKEIIVLESQAAAYEDLYRKYVDIRDENKNLKKRLDYLRNKNGIQ